MNDKYGSSLEKLRKLEDSCSSNEEDELQTKKTTVTANANANANANSAANTNRHPVCQSITPNPGTAFVPTAMAFWNQNILQILSASRIPQDTRFMFHDFTTQLLQIISP